jgi:hypothetical protein
MPELLTGICSTEKIPKTFPQGIYVIAHREEAFADFIQCCNTLGMCFIQCGKTLHLSANTSISFNQTFFRWVGENDHSLHFPLFCNT